MAESPEYSSPLELSPSQRRQLWRQLTTHIERYLQTVRRLPVSPKLDPEALRRQLRQYDFTQPLAPLQALEIAVRGLTEHQVHTPHPMYYGLFNPAPATMGIAADALVAAFNPQIAAWSHSPFAAEVERYLIEWFGAHFGFPHTDGAFTSGGMEANHTALLCALAARFPDFRRGLRSLHAQPVLYASSETHHSIQKAARLVGLGDAAVRLIPTDTQLRMDPLQLHRQVRQDRAAGLAPFLVVATAGATNSGIIDPLPEIAARAREHNLWMHVDAAWGGAAILVPELKPLLAGLQHAHSITFDAHKWLSAPMGAGMFLTRCLDVMDAAFRVETAYMPKDAGGLPVHDPHLHSMQWSRRFIGLKVFLALLTAGQVGLAETIRHQTAMGQRLRSNLQAAGWTIVNSTPLPVVCFRDSNLDDQAQESIVRHIVSSGRAWISTTRLAGRLAIRACVTSYRTQPADIDQLTELLSEARHAQHHL
jgi:glutamate/tyrosine decarboxylase-like PLP-dependent enzyme